jgi:hypothetical protein
MPSAISDSSGANPSALALDLKLPKFDIPQVKHCPSAMTWSEAMQAFAAAREHYLRDFDSPQQRLLDKNPDPFRLPNEESDV